ncbi:hypothetical protein ACWEO4_44700 [Streptomyces sp. NPDC004393]
MSFRTAQAPKTPQTAPGLRLPTAFWRYAAFTAVTTTGFATFGVLSYHLVQRHLLTTAWVPVLYAAAMAVDAIAALTTGWLYDRHGPRVLVALPVLTAALACAWFTGFLRGCPGLQAGEESDSCGAGQG